MSITDEEYQDIENYVASSSFQLFLDEELRSFCEQCVQTCLKALDSLSPDKKGNPRRVKKSQLHSIMAIVQTSGFEGIRHLSSIQGSKNTAKQENQVFWKEFDNILISTPSASSLTAKIVEIVRGRLPYLPDPESISDKHERKIQKRKISELSAPIMNEVLPIFCEHFICHYFYRA